MTDLDIARAASPKPITEIAAAAGIPEHALVPYGHDKAKVDVTALGATQTASGKQGKLILVTAISPTPAGEGKTTTTVGLGDGLKRIGKQTMICLREPSLGPCFGVKGGAAGGGYAQIVPMESINLHFTGDFHAITSAHNLLSAMLDNHIYWGNDLGIDARRVVYRRVVDLNDRALREVTVGLGGVANGYPRTAGFDITVASEVMAILCLADSLDDLCERLGNIIVAWRKDGTVITAKELGADGAMTVLLRDAMSPNLVQSLEHTPAFVHGGPFANIAHGCNSVLATKTGLKMADYVVTEAGFGADLGAEKFFDIKCRSAGLNPEAVVLVATIRALKMHGGVAKTDLGTENAAAVRAGCSNLARHVENIRKFGIDPIVAINSFVKDTPAEIDALIDECNKFGVEVVLCSHWANGGAGTEELAHAVVAKIDAGTNAFKPLYADDLALSDKIRTVAQEIYGADDVQFQGGVLAQLDRFAALGYGNLPVCMAKTQYSFSTDPTKMGAPSGHQVTVREVRLQAGAKFVVAICGDIMTMPGLPRRPAAESIALDESGQIDGLF